MDGSGAAAPQPWYMSQDFDDADTLARALRAAGVDYVPLESGPYHSRLTAIGWGDMILQRAVDRAHVARGVIDRDSVVLLFPLRQQTAPMVNGLRVEQTEGVLLGPGAELHVLCHAGTEWAAIGMSAAAAADLAALAGWQGPRDRPGETLRVPAAIMAPLQRAVTTATDAVDQFGAAAPPRVLAAMLTDLLDHVGAAFAEAEAGAVPRMSREGLRLVGAAEALLHAHPERPLFTADLCDALRISPRSLHQAFVATTGMSPQAYLRRRRLMMVHAVLKDGGGDAGLVKSVALSHGFWHLGHFARSYRQQFGQTPSETLASARSGTHRGVLLPFGMRQHPAGGPASATGQAAGSPPGPARDAKTG